MPKLGGRYHGFTQKMSNAVSNIQLIMLAEGLILNLRTIFLLALDWFKKKKTIEKGILMRISQLSVAFHIITFL